MRLASERSGLALVALALAGCGPMVGSGQGSAEGSAEGSASSEGEGASSTTTTATVDDTGSTGSTGDDGTTEPPLAGWCLHGTPLPELASSDELLAVYDADADGRDEVWMAGPVKGLEQWSRIWAYELGDGPRLTPILEVVRLGSTQAMVDIDGDGLRDLVMLEVHIPAHYWMKGLPDPSIDATPLPLMTPSTTGIWLDADGDGDADYFERVPTGLVLYLGDGAGGFVQTDTLDFGVELGSADVWPSGLPGRLLVGFQEQSFGAPSTTIWAVEVSAAGAVTMLASGSIDTVEPHHVGDIDDDMIPDVIGFDVVDNEGLSVASQSAPGSYTMQTLEIPLHGMAVGAFVSAGQLDVLHWTSSASEVSLRPREGQAWPTSIPVTVDGPWDYAGDFHPMQADGEGTLEILHRSSDGHDLWVLEPCE